MTDHIIIAVDATLLERIQAVAASMDIAIDDKTACVQSVLETLVEAHYMEWCARDMHPASDTTTLIQAALDRITLPDVARAVQRTPTIGGALTSAQSYNAIWDRIHENHASDPLIVRVKEMPTDAELWKEAYVTVYMAGVTYSDPAAMWLMVERTFRLLKQQNRVIDNDPTNGHNGHVLNAQDLTQPIKEQS